MTLKEFKAFCWAVRQRDSLVKSGWEIVRRSSDPIGWRLVNSKMSVIDIELLDFESCVIVYILRDGKVKVHEQF